MCRASPRGSRSASVCSVACRARSAASLPMPPDACRTTATISSYSIPALPECISLTAEIGVLYVPAALHLLHAYVAFDVGQGRDYQPDHGRETRPNGTIHSLF